MNTAVILLGLFVAFVATEEECPVKVALKQGFQQCKESMKPSEETLELVTRDQGWDNKEVQCFRACMATKAGLMNGAKVDIEKIESLLQSAQHPNENKIKSIIGIMTDCKKAAEVSDDVCVVVGNYFKCIKAKVDATKAAQ